MHSTLDTEEVACTPFTDQRPGTAGLRKQVRTFSQPHYLEMFAQAMFDTLQIPVGATLVIGGDGRWFNREAIQSLIAVAAGNGIRRFIVGQRGWLSTPAASHLIRKSRAAAGVLLTASHNPGGPDGDFGIKFNMASGGQAPEAISEAVFQRSRVLRGYRRARLPALDLERTGLVTHGGLQLQIVDPVADYAELMQQLFDFEQMRDWLRQGHRLCFDGMHGITGPYARRILVDQLGASADSLMRCEPLEDFGGIHPDPNPVDAADLVHKANGQAAPDLLAASDGDGDRNMLLAPGFFLSPGDSVALLLAQHRCAPGYRGGMPGVARSMPTSRALDVVAAALNLPCYETPTGWRFFCNLLEDGRIGLCGEESFGTGSAHCREKDGLWAVLFWLNVLAATGSSLPALASAHWAEHGRHHYQRWDYHCESATRAADLIDALRNLLPALQGSRPAGGTIVAADEFAYHDPVDGSDSGRQGLRLVFDDGCRIVFRLSGTGTAGATLRVYLERHLKDAAGIRLTTDTAIAGLGSLAAQVARIQHYTGLAAPSARI